MFRYETKQWFKLAVWHVKIACINIGVAIGNVFFGIKMAALDVIERIRRSMRKWHITIEYLTGQRQFAAHSFAYFLAPTYITNNGNVAYWKLGPFTLKTKGSLCGDTYFMAIRRMIKK